MSMEGRFQSPDQDCTSMTAILDYTLLPFPGLSSLCSPWRALGSGRTIDQRLVKSSASEPGPPSPPTFNSYVGVPRDWS